MTEIEQLRAIVVDETLPAEEQRIAAAHIVKLADAAVMETGVSEDDPEVVKLMAPWKRDTPSQIQLAEVFAGAGYQTNGHSLAGAKATVIRTRVTRSRLATVVDESRSRLERESAAQAIKDDLPMRNKFSMNNISPSGMVDAAKIIPGGAVPLTISDVWEL